MASLMDKHDLNLRATYNYASLPSGVEASAHRQNVQKPPISKALPSGPSYTQTKRSASNLKQQPSPNAKAATNIKDDSNGATRVRETTQCCLLACSTTATTLQTL